jgi:cytochrome o ubiquinol oxidase subunit I
VLPKVFDEEPYWEIKRRAIESQQLAAEPDYEPIEMPRNSPTGIISAFFATITGFAFIWHIWWLAGVGIVAAYAVFVWFAWRDVEEFEIPAAEIAEAERERRRIRQQWLDQHPRITEPA